MSETSLMSPSFEIQQGHVTDEQPLQDFTNFPPEAPSFEVSAPYENYSEPTRHDAYTPRDTTTPYAGSLPTSSANSVPTPSVGSSIAFRPGARSTEQIKDATECATFAIAALKTRDVAMAIDRLEKALASLR